MQRLENIFGLVFDPDAVLADEAMRSLVGPVTHTVYDFAHVYLVSGVGQMEMHMFLQACSVELGWSYRTCHDWMQLWRWPKWINDRPKDIFNTVRAAHAGETFKAGASEMLSMYVPFRDMCKKQKIYQVDAWCWSWLRCSHCSRFGMGSLWRNRGLRRQTGAAAFWPTWRLTSAPILLMCRHLSSTTKRTFLIF